MKTIFKYFLLIFVSIIFGSCTDRSGNPQIYDWSGKEQTVVSEKLLSDSALIGTAGAYVIGKWMVTSVMGSTKDHEYILYRLAQDSLLHEGRFVRRGRGPDEVIQSHLHMMPGENKAYVLANNMSRSTCVYRIDMSHGAADILDNRQWAAESCPENNPVMLRAVVDSVTFLCRSPYGSSDLISLYTIGDTTVHSLGLPYPDRTGKHSPDLLRMVYAGRWFKHPTEPWFVYTAQNGGYVLTCKLKDGRMTDVKELYNELPQFSIAADGLNVLYKDGSMRGYSAAISDKYIYLLESGITFGDSRAGRTQQAYRNINVFRWDGTPVRRLNLDARIRGTFSVTPDDKYIYFSTVDLEAGEEQIRRVKLES